MGINSGFFFQEADAAYYCSSTCQAKLKAEENKTTTQKAEPCYGIYCNKDPEKSTSTSTSTSTKVSSTSVKTEPCYGIFCNKPKNDLAQTKELPFQSVPLGRNFIAIKISKSCENVDYCPTIKELADLYDNSNKYLSGDFKFDNETGKWYRESPKVPKMFEFYRYTDLPWILWVDPDDYTWDRSKQIIIEPHLRYVGTNNKIDDLRMRYEYEGLSLLGCYSATIGWKDRETNNATSGEAILLDVLNYFYSNCRERIETNPTIEIFMGTDIFEDCDQACLYHREQLKLELKSEALVSKDQADSEKEEEEPKTKEPCYGIYCNRQKVEDETDKTAQELRDEKLQELKDIKECKEIQIWDEVKIDGKYRRHSYDCNVEEERDQYLLIMRPRVETTTDSTNKTEAEKEIDYVAECEKLKASETNIEIKKHVDCKSESDRMRFYNLK